MKNFSIGIDFSKLTFDATILYRGEETMVEVGYSKFENELKGFKSFIKWVKATILSFNNNKNTADWIFCGENTGVCSSELSDFLASKGYDMWLESALTIHRKSGIVRCKNDKADSKRIAEYAIRFYDRSIRLHEPDSKAYKKLKSLFAAHLIITKDKIAKNNQIKSGTLDNCPQALKMAKKQLDLIKDQLACIDAEIKRLLAENDEFSKNYKILISVKGVGLITAAYVIIRTHNFKYMIDAKVFGNYIGVVPSHREQSGTSIDRVARVSRYRDREGNCILSQSANTAIRFNPVIKDYYNRLVGRGVHPNKAKNNCKFKIINILMALIRNDTPFDPEKYGKSKAQWQKTA